MPTVSMIATVKDEGPWLLEWIAHNQAIGFDGIAVCSNDCSDGTDGMLDRLARLGVLTHVRNHPPYKGMGQNIQLAAYTRARFQPCIASSDWVIMLDADEFLNSKIGGGTVPELIDSFPDDVDAVPICWRLFGDSGRSGWIDGTLCETLTHASPPNRRYAFKTLFRRHQDYPRIGVHRPRFLAGTAEEHMFEAHFAHPDGTPIAPRHLAHPGEFISKTVPRWDIVQINHYMVRTREIFALKTLRGDAVQTRADTPMISRHSEKSFNEFNCNDIEDTSISRTAAARHEHLRALRADPELSRLEQTAKRIAQDRMQALMASQDAAN